VRAARWTWALALAPLLAASTAAAQQPGATVIGRVLEARNGAPIGDAIVEVEGTPLAVLSDSTGRYVLRGVPPGPQQLRARRLGYADSRVSVSVPARGVVAQDIRMAETALAVPGITVTAQVAGRARGELGTASVIDREAIREQPAVSLAGVLQLVPGQELSPPGLDDVEQLSLRSVPTTGSSAATGSPSASELAAFGTLIVLDGVPLSNNANLQTLGPRGELSFTTSAGGGVDLRRIPASTLERVEVIRGVPSVRYGDLTQGAVIVQTRAGSVRPDLRVQYDAHTGEGSVVGGESFQQGRQAGTLSFDLARTATQPGITHAEAYRAAASLSHRLDLGAMQGGQGRLALDTRIDAYRLFDDRPENPNFQPGFSSWSHDAGLRASENAQLRLSDRDALHFTGAYSVVQQRSFVSALRVRGAMPFTDRLTPGLSEGHFVLGQYTSKVNVDGAPHLLYARLEAEGHRLWLGAQHDVQLGVELRREWNSGPGYQFDIENPPQVTFNSVEGYDRPRSYSSVPPLVTSGFYLDDRLSAPLPGDLALNAQAGVRLDLLHGGGTWFSRVRDHVVEPRIEAELLIRPWLRLRAGWGRLAKAPSLDELFPAPQYFDVVNVNYFANDPAERLAVLTTSIIDPSNPQLGFSRATKAELGLEAGFGRGIISLVGYQDRIDGGIGIHQIPSFLLRAHYALTDTILGNGIPPQIIQPALYSDTVPIFIDRPENDVTQVTRGIELSALLPEITPLRTRIQIQGTYARTEQWSSALYFGTPDVVSGFEVNAVETRIPYWKGVVEHGERALLTYRLIHQQPALGLVVTATIQHNISDHLYDVAGRDTLAYEGYITRDGSLVPVPAADRGQPQYADLRRPRSGSLQPIRATPQDWFMDLEVAKTLPLGGRLGFWVYNLTDRPGIFTDPNVLARPYLPMRFGLEMSLPAPRSLWKQQ
jgi:outer membrane receptor protein involved in Fe transport